MASNKRTLLFISFNNSCTSQMAEAWAEKLLAHGSLVMVLKPLSPTFFAKCHGIVNHLPYEGPELRRVLSQPTCKPARAFLELSGPEPGQLPGKLM